MSDDITIGSANDVVIVSEAVRTALHSVGRVADELLEVRARLVLATIETEALPVPLLPASVRRSLDAMQAAARILDTAERRARLIDRAVLECLAVYDAAERQVASVWNELDRQLCWLTGFGVRTAAVPLALGLAGAAVDWMIVARVTGVSPSAAGKDVGRFLEQHPRIISNPLTVGALHESLDNSDEFGEGFLGIPEPVGELLGPGGARVLGVPSSSRVVEELGGVFGLLKETAVTVDETGSATVPTDGRLSTTLTERANHFFSADKQPNDEEVRIEKYTQPGKPDRFEVYIAGTVTFDPKSKGEPFDMTSNVNGVAQQSPGAYRAVVDAMRQAGITSTSPVVLNGYSQGGLIASLVASSNRYNVKGLVTFGSPSGQVPVAADIPTLTVRHSEDIVPALGGPEVNRHAVVVYRTLFDDHDPPTDLPVAGHYFGFYEQTAALIDKSDNPEVRGVLDPINSFEDGSTNVTTSWFRAYRVQP